MVKTKILICLLFLFFWSNFLFAPIDKELDEKTEKIYKEIAYKKAYVNFLSKLKEKSEMYKDKDYFFYKDKMPRDFLEVFLLSTENLKERRILIYSMMIVESMGFKEYFNKNNDNSTDHGPLMLNSKNIDCEYFNSKFFPKSSFIERLKESNVKDPHVVFISACVNLIRAHLKMYDGDIKKTLKAYNGGPKVNKKRYKNTSLDIKTTKYYNDCMKISRKVEKDYNKFKIINKDKNALNMYFDEYFSFEQDWEKYKKFKKLMSTYSMKFMII